MLLIGTKIINPNRNHLYLIIIIIAMAAIATGQIW